MVYWSAYADYRPEREGDSALPPLEDLRIRPVCAEDIEWIATLGAQRSGGDYHRAVRRLEQELSAIAEGAERLLLAAECAKGPIGFGRAERFLPDPNAPSNVAPAGLYLLGLLVHRDFRRRGVGALLTQMRLEWIGRHAAEAYYFANARNKTSIALHARFGFREVTSDFWFPGISFEGHYGILFRASLSGAGTSCAV